MSEFFKAELKDKFLQYTLDRNDYFEVQLLYDEFLRPNYSLAYVQKLIREILDHDPGLLDIMSGNGVRMFMLSATPDTLEFIEEGGFKSLYVQEEEKWDIFLEQLSNTRKLTSHEKESSAQKGKKIFKRERLLLFLLITVLTINFLYTIFGLVNSFFAESEENRIKEIEEKLGVLENNNLELRKELDSIQHFYRENPE